MGVEITTTFYGELFMDIGGTTTGTTTVGSQSFINLVVDNSSRFVRFKLRKLVGSATLNIVSLNVHAYRKVN